MESLILGLRGLSTKQAPDLYISVSNPHLPKEGQSLQEHSLWGQGLRAISKTFFTCSGVNLKSCGSSFFLNGHIFTSPYFCL
jgi:hypothetical protein